MYIGVFTFLAFALRLFQGVSRERYEMPWAIVCPFSHLQRLINVSESKSS